MDYMVVMTSKQEMGSSHLLMLSRFRSIHAMMFACLIVSIDWILIRNCAVFWMTCLRSGSTFFPWMTWQQQDSGSQYNSDGSGLSNPIGCPNESLSVTSRLQGIPWRLRLRKWGEEKTIHVGRGWKIGSRKAYSLCIHMIKMLHTRHYILKTYSLVNHMISTLHTKYYVRKTVRIPSLKTMEASQLPSRAKFTDCICIIFTLSHSSNTTSIPYLRAIL